MLIKLMSGKGYDWETLNRARAVVVDVGGGFGSQSMVLAEAFTELNFVVQDRKPVIENAQSVSALFH